MPCVCAYVYVCVRVKAMQSEISHTKRVQKAHRGQALGHPLVVEQTKDPGDGGCGGGGPADGEAPAYEVRWGHCGYSEPMCYWVIGVVGIIGDTLGYLGLLGGYCSIVSGCVTDDDRHVVHAHRREVGEAPALFIPELGIGEGDPTGEIGLDGGCLCACACVCICVCVCVRMCPSYLVRCVSRAVEVVGRRETPAGEVGRSRLLP